MEQIKTVERIQTIEQIKLPPRAEMMEAFLSGDASYEGVFITAVKTTGIFCRPTCGARKPDTGNVEFYVTTKDALFAGFRPCKRCRPLESSSTIPDWLKSLTNDVEAEPSRRWRDRDLRALGLHPDRVRRWFQTHHGMTFQAYSRARRLGTALDRIGSGSDVTGAAYESGYESISGFNMAFRTEHGKSPTEVKMQPRMNVERIPTPLGMMIAYASDEALYLLEFMDRRMLETQMKHVERRFNCVLVQGENRTLKQLKTELTAYFCGELEEFTVPLMTAGTPFQEDVWKELLRIPYGTTTSYGALAGKLGRPKAVRAVARANGDNRVSIIIPCHRVIGSDGKLTGYGGGLWRKQRLLDLERNQLSLGFD